MTALAIVPGNTPGTYPPGLTIVIREHRPAPQGSKRHVGRGRLIEQSTRVKPWRAAVTAAAAKALADTGAHPFREWDPLSRSCGDCGVAEADHVLFRGAVSVEVTFTVRKSKSAGRRFCWPTTRDSGDLDKLQRSLFDAISDATGVWVDDSRVVEVVARKVHPGEGVEALDAPGAVVRIWGLS